MSIYPLLSPVNALTFNRFRCIITAKKEIFMRNPLAVTPEMIETTAIRYSLDTRHLKDCIKREIKESWREERRNTAPN